MLNSLLAWEPQRNMEQTVNNRLDSGLPGTVESIRTEAKAISWVTVIVALGLGLRFYHYLRNPAMWHDEAAVVVNVLHKDFLALLGLLYFSEAAPPLFLWLERACLLTLGDSTYALRLPPFLASCAALLLMVPLARHLLHPQFVPWCLFLMACSDRLLAHSCESKPYAIDVFIAVCVLGLFLYTQSWPSARRLSLFALLAPVVIFLVYPGIFLCAGLLLALLPVVRRERRTQVWLAYGLFVAAVLLSAALLVLGPAHAQRNEHMDFHWTAFFPDWHRPWKFPFWAGRNTFRVFDYCFEPLGSLLTILAGVGVASLWRRGQRTLLIALVGPIALNFIAACLEKYPYGGSRVMIYTLPAAALLVAVGIPPATAWLRARHRVAPVIVFILLLLPLSRALYHVVRPWKRAASDQAAAFVLAHRQPSDGVTGNYWSDLYYFRHLGSAYRPIGSDFRAEIRPFLPPPDRTTPDRLWIIMTGDNAADRVWNPHDLPPGKWRVLTRQTFRSVEVTLVGREESRAE